MQIAFGWFYQGMLKLLLCKPPFACYVCRHYFCDVYLDDHCDRGLPTAAAATAAATSATTPCTASDTFALLSAAARTDLGQKRKARQSYHGLLKFRVQALLDMLQVDMKIRTVLRSWDERLCQFVTKQRLRVSLRLLLLQVPQMLLLSPDILLVCGVHDIEVVENLVDVLFPQRTDRGVPARPWALVALTSGRLPIHGESDTSRCKHCQSERMSVG
jgi:hypothetical protein